MWRNKSSDYIKSSICQSSVNTYIFLSYCTQIRFFVISVHSVKLQIAILKGNMNEGNVIPPLTDSYNDLCLVSFCWLLLIKHDEGSTACFYDCCLFTALPGQRLWVCACKHYVLIIISLTHRQIHRHTRLYGKQQSCRRECSGSMSGESTVWHDPLNNRCSHTHSGKYAHWLTKAKTYSHTCTKYMQ